MMIPPTSPTKAQRGDAGSTKSIKLRGYVTEIRSQTSFDIDDYRVTRESTMALDFEKDENTDSAVSLPEDIRIGTEVEIKGGYNPESHELTAKSIKVFPSETRTVKRTAILESQPQLQRHGTAWEGHFRADGQTLLVDEVTKLTIVPNKTQSKAEKEAAKAAKKTAKSGGTPEPVVVALGRPDDVHLNMYVSYEGVRDKTGTIRLKIAEFKDNETTASEKKLWKTLTPKVMPFKAEKPGQLRIAKVGKFRIVPDEAVQQYTRELAMRLIPRSQRNLPDGDPRKIPFQIYVIEDKTPNAFAVANGTVVIHSGMFPALEDEAQLAFVLGHEIVHATQEHTMRQLEFHRKKRFALQLAAVAASAYGAYGVRDLLNLVSAAITNGYQRSLENQADRLGMEYMVVAGYDPREAPRAWKAMSLKYGDAPTNFFWSSHNNNALRRSYLMAELRNNYTETDFASAKRDSEEFHRVAASLTARYAKKSKVKVKY